jgi:hypothetical protein
MPKCDALDNKQTSNCHQTLQKSDFDKRICALSVNVVNKPIGLISAVISWAYAADPLSVNGF